MRTPSRALLLWLLQSFVLGCGGAATPAPVQPAPHTEQPKGDVRERLKALLKSLATADDLAAWRQAHAEELDAAVTAEAVALGSAMMSSGDPQRFGLGIAAYTVASLGADVTGQAALAVECRYNAAQGVFMRTENPADYASLRSSALNLTKQAESLGEGQLAFHAATLAANCGYFGNEAKLSQSAELADAAMTDWTAAGVLGISSKHPTADAQFENYASLGGAIAADALNAYFIAEASGKKPDPTIIRAFTAMTEKSIPIGFFFQKTGDAEKTQKLNATLAMLSSRYGDPNLARQRVASVGSRANAVASSAPLLQLRKLDAQYEIEESLNASPATLNAFEVKARELISTVRASMHSPAGRVWASYELDLSYGPIVARRLASTNPPSAELVYDAAEATKARTLLDRMHRRPTTLPVALRAKQVELEKRALAFNPADVSSEDRLMQEMRLVSKLEALQVDPDRWKAVKELEALYDSASAGFQGVATPVSMGEAIKSLKPREMVLEFFAPEHAHAPTTELWAVMLTSKGAKVQRVGTGLLARGAIQTDGKAPVDMSPLGDLIVTTRVAIRQSDDEEAKKGLRRLHEQLIEPLGSSLDLTNLDRLIIVPHGVLHYVPFHALLAGDGKFLGENAPLVIAPSVSVLSAMKHPRPARPQLLALAPTSSALGALPLAVNEVKAAGARLRGFNPKLLLGAEASFDALSQHAPTATVLHLSTHGVFPEDDAADNHYLWLSSAPGFDGKLPASRARELDLRAASLVVLSVCDAAIYRTGPGDEPYGLVPAFIEAGAGNVLGALWPIEDKFAPQFMDVFYANLTRSSPAKAYQAAMKTFIGNDEFIRRWAGFVLVGSGVTS